MSETRCLERASRELISEPKKGGGQGGGDGGGRERRERSGEE